MSNRTKETPEEKISTHSIGQPFTSFSVNVTVEGSAYHLKNAGEILFENGMEVIDGIRDALQCGEFEADPAATAGALYAAEHLLRLGMAMKVASVAAGKRP